MHAESQEPLSIYQVPFSRVLTVRVHFVLLRAKQHCSCLDLWQVRPPNLANLDFSNRLANKLLETYSRVCTQQ